MAKTVSIIIQARSTSTRFPRKIFEKIGHKTILKHVLDACNNCASYVNKRTHQHGIVCNVALAVPENDELIPHYSKNIIIQGDENDVLSRYQKAAEILKSDYIVRITADCPFIPAYIISKCINLAVRDELDFLSNANPRYRTFPDGHDVEVFSMKMLTWANQTATLPEDREHVTSLMYKSPPAWSKSADVIGFLNLYRMKVKLSIDTKEDLDNMTEMYDSLCESVVNCKKSYRL